MSITFYTRTSPAPLAFAHEREARGSLPDTTMTTAYSHQQSQRLRGALRRRSILAFAVLGVVAFFLHGRSSPSFFISRQSSGARRSRFRDVSHPISFEERERLRQAATLAQRRAEESEATLELTLASREDDREIGEERVAAYVGPLGPRCDAEESLASWGGEGYALHPPNMSDVEATTMLQYIRGKFVGATWKEGEATYLEWGSGGSTSTYGTAAGTAYSVEHVPEWCSTIRSWPEMACMTESKRWQLRCHDAGVELENWGFPKKSGSGTMRRFRDRMREYVQGPKFFRPTTYDVVLIDGRQRNAWRGGGCLTRTQGTPAPSAVPTFYAYLFFSFSFFFTIRAVSVELPLRLDCLITVPPCRT